jgi:hypothetical protein
LKILNGRRYVHSKDDVDASVKLKLHLFDVLWVYCGFVEHQLFGLVESCEFFVYLLWIFVQLVAGVQL